MEIAFRHLMALLGLVVIYLYVRNQEVVEMKKLHCVKSQSGLKEKLVRSLNQRPLEKRPLVQG